MSKLLTCHPHHGPMDTDCWLAQDEAEMSDTKHTLGPQPGVWCACDEFTYCSMHAAAPDLLAALEAAPDYLDRTKAEFVDLYEAWLKVRTAALAKAKGKL